VGPVAHSAAALVAAAALPVALGGLALRPAWRVGLRERLGGHPGGAPGAVWLHGASVGEIRAAAGLIDALRAADEAVIASTTTVAGRDLLRRLRPEVPCGLAPLDHPWCVAAVLSRTRPSALVLVETELWPIWISGAHARGIPVLVVSGRLSERSFRRYGRLGPLLRGTLRRLAAVGARSAEDARRFVALGVPEARVTQTGDLKLEPPEDLGRLAPDLEAALGAVPLFVAGSTHEGEEEAALEAARLAEASGQALALALAPRRLARADGVAARCAAAGRRVRRRSALGSAPLAAGEVLLLDTLGELAGLYARAAVAFVGGTLVPVGGHNLLEPLQQGCPVLFGSHTEGVAEAAALARASGAGWRVDDAAALGAALVSVLADPVAARARGRRGREALAEHRGSTQRTLELLERVRAEAAAPAAQPKRGRP
jgi:3-deoxy-D-manno-octulosonic-acid transferase